MDGLSDGLPPVLDTTRVAELLGLSRQSVLLMVRDGRLPARRVPGGRKYQFLTEEVLAALAHRDGKRTQLTLVDLDPDGGQPPRPDESSPDRMPADIDPCDVWGAAPAVVGDGWARRCLDVWLRLAEDAGLRATCTSAPDADTAGPCVGVVDVDDLTYRVLTGPRKRARLVDDDGEARWGLIDSVWVEPVATIVG